MARHERDPRKAAPGDRSLKDLQRPPRCGRPSAGWASHLRSRWTPALAVVAVLALAALVVACTVNPATGERQLTLVSESQEIALGEQTDEQIVQSLGVVDDEGLQSYVDRLGQELAAASERPDLPWTFRVVDDEVVNAFALPGGYIYVTRGILAHLNSEAELAGVLGHEIGHVTARHSVEQLSRAQLAQIGLGVGMVLSEDFRQYGDLAQTGLGVLFLKFGRDDERQADDLGLRYMRRSQYDPRELVDVFSTLERASQARGGQRIPGWLSTHPTPQNRIERIGEEVRELDLANQRTVVNRERYLEQLDGMVFGADPRQGFFRDNVFYHPELAFSLAFPEGWQTINQRDSVSGVSPQQNAAVTLSLAPGGSPSSASREFFGQQGIQSERQVRLGFGGLPAVADYFSADTQQGRVVGVAAFVEYDDRVYRILGYTTSERWRNFDRALEGSVASFQRVRDRRVLDVEPQRLDVVRLPRAMSLQEFERRYGSSVDLETLARINGLDSTDARLSAGQRVKRVVGGTDF